jgi:hypothetical protein
MAFSFGGFFGEDVSTVALMTFEAARRAFKAFSRSAIGFDFWHDETPLFVNELKHTNFLILTFSVGESIY